MTSLKESAEKYEPKKTLNVADLPSISILEPIEERSGTDAEKQKFTYKVLIRDEKEYRVPNTVLEAIQDLLKEMPGLTEVRVTKKGEGMGTKYSVIPLKETPVEQKTE